MSDLTSIQGKALLDRRVLIKLLAQVEPEALGRNSTLFDIGYERCKADVLRTLSESLGSEFATSNSVKLIRELRNG